MGRDDPRMARYLWAAKRLTRNLLRVGHVEEQTKDRYRIVPPTVVSLAGDRHLLIGARSDAILNEYKRTRGVTVPPVVGQRDAPEAWYLVGTDECIANASEKVGVAVSRDRWDEVLASLPALSDVLANAPAESIPDRIEQWKPDVRAGRSRWAHATTAAGEPGLYRTIRKPHQWFLRPESGADTVRLDTPERRFAAALLLRGVSRVNYDSDSRILFIPVVGFSLPLLIDRALIIASGRLPEWKSHGWYYCDIDPGRAWHVARILGAKLKATT
jgi:hypothetical protein